MLVGVVARQELGGSGSRCAGAIDAAVAHPRNEPMGERWTVARAKCDRRCAGGGGFTRDITTQFQIGIEKRRADRRGIDIATVEHVMEPPHQLATGPRRHCTTADAIRHHVDRGRSVERKTAGIRTHVHSPNPAPFAIASRMPPGVAGACPVVPPRRRHFPGGHPAWRNGASPKSCCAACTYGAPNLAPLGAMAQAAAYATTTIGARQRRLRSAPRGRPAPTPRPRI